MGTLLNVNGINVNKKYNLLMGMCAALSTCICNQSKLFADSTILPVDIYIQKSQTTPNRPTNGLFSVCNQRLHWACDNLQSIYACVSVCVFEFIYIFETKYIDAVHCSIKNRLGQTRNALRQELATTNSYNYL